MPEDNTSAQFIKNEFTRLVNMAFPNASARQRRDMWMIWLASASITFEHVTYLSQQLKEEDAMKFMDNLSQLLKSEQERFVNGNKRQ